MGSNGKAKKECSVREREREREREVLSKDQVKSTYENSDRKKSNFYLMIFQTITS